MKVSVQGVREGLKLIIIDCWEFYMRPFVVCLGIQEQNIGLTTETTWRKDLWTSYHVSEGLPCLQHENQCYKHATHLKTYLLAILGRVYYFTTILTKF